MENSREENVICEEILTSAEEAIRGLLPCKSKERYEVEYESLERLGCEKRNKKSVGHLPKTAMMLFKENVKFVAEAADDM
ncbi:hypothetical protein BDFB_014556 [Asbolus verrucosus]|uniref:Uncharacterized protein n=1 Tax=Asbolus verrucosus TaxID=1661398 RepID=A0A482W2F1_ASBVE|nr:hypothetical protein BDFB_014556 [Asbolus verrucosus]